MFALAMLSSSARGPFVGLRVDGKILALDEVSARYPAHALPEGGSRSLLALIETWQRSFDALQELVECVRRGGSREVGGAGGQERTRGEARAEDREATREGHGLVPIDPSTVRYHPPISRPGKILHSAANFREHVAEMAGYNAAAGATDPAKRFTGDKAAARPYLFLTAASALTGAFDDIAMPAGEHQIDWEAELAAVIGRRGRSIGARQALAHVAGYMVTNDVSCRDLLWREDRQNFRTDWLASKSHDGFAPMGPWFVPGAFVANPGKLKITLKVNDVLKQNGNTSEMIFSLEEQIEYASGFMTLEAGDIFVTGTVGGVGQGRGEFLKPGDMLETAIDGVGVMRNRIIAAR